MYVMCMTNINIKRETWRGCAHALQSTTAQHGSPAQARLGLNKARQHPDIQHVVDIYPTPREDVRDAVDGGRVGILRRRNSRLPGEKQTQNAHSVQANWRWFHGHSRQGACQRAGVRGREAAYRLRDGRGAIDRCACWPRIVGRMKGSACVPPDSPSPVPVPVLVPVRYPPVTPENGIHWELSSIDSHFYRYATLHHCITI